MKNFDYWDNLHRNEQLEEFSHNKIGLLWLKIKSIIRVELVKGFLEFSGYTLNAKKQSDNFRELFELLSVDIDKLEILSEAQANPKMLAKWLYENQGEVRFGAENRLFLVLVDTDEFNNSWKLKRNIDLLEPAIISYLDNFKNKRIVDLNVSFKFKGKPHGFSALADVIFVVK